MEIDFSELYHAVSDERVKRWLWNQLPEFARLTGTIDEYVVDSIRIRFEPTECDAW